MTDPTQLLAALKGLVGNLPKRDLVYPSGFVPPKRPDIEEIKATADRLWEQHRFWRVLIDITHRWT
ncbi:hypothetical protein M3M33_17525, partial [Loigolactobacillus coryniformis]|uniref:hypothetical protein n=1 Tax=Loigolactobacillus coryniformis TaxID=1610 RepID=UPI00201A4B1E